MPLYTQNNLPEGPLTIDDYEPSFAAYMRAAWGDADSYNPGTVAGNMLEASERRYGFNVMDVAEAGGLTGGLEELAQTDPLPAWSQEEQKAYIRDEGLEGALSPGEHYTRPELEFLARLKHEEIERMLTREKASAWYAPFGFLAGLGASFIDPINLATTLVPVLPEARMMQLLAKSGSAWGRAGIRAGVGAAEGAVGAAVVEPMILGGKTELQQEYGLANSLMNVVFGAAMGAVMKPAAGALGDWMRRKKGQRQPWEYVPSSDLTERLRTENAARIWEGMRESGSEHLAPEHAEAAAALWDATLRGYAHDTGELVGDVYARYRTEWRGGGMEIVDVRGDALEQAMQRSTAYNKLDFIQDVRAGKIEYFVGQIEPTAIKEFFGIDDLVINYPYYFIQHLDNRRRDATYALFDMADDVLANADYIKKTGKRKTGEILYSAVRRNADGTATLIVFELSKSRKKGNRILPHSAITEKQNAIENVVSQKERASTSTNTGSAPGVMPKPLKEDELRVLEALKDAEGSASVKKIQQTSSDGNPRARVTFGEADAYAMVEFFKSADPSSAPHEMYHIFRRIMSEMYDDPNASEASRERYRKACEFVGAEPGRVWTREQEEMFARAGERFLLEGVTPNPRMGDVMESFKQWMGEVYGNAERSGLEISDGMRNVFGKMMGTAEDGDISLTLRNENAARPGAGMRESGAEKLAPEHAEAAAALWDATLRGYAHDTGELIGDVHARYRTEWRGGGMEIVDVRGDALEQAMYRSKSVSIRDFLAEVDAYGNKPVYVFGNVQRSDAGLENAALQLGGSDVNHIRNRHPDFNRWEEIEKVINEGQAYAIPQNETTKLPGRAFVTQKAGEWHAVLGYIQQTKWGQRFSIGTSFIDTPNKMKGWLKQIQATPLYQGAGSSPAKPKPAQAGRLSELKQDGLSGTFINSFVPDGNPRARVTFGEADAYAMVEFFKAADPSTAPHEMYHIFRRIMSEMYDDPNASEASRERYRKACEFVGAEPGKVWTREQEEMFARAGERFLLEGVTPNPRMGDVMESFKQWMGEVYGNAERSGLEISDGMREVFGKMMGTAEDGDISLTLRNENAARPGAEMRESGAEKPAPPVVREGMTRKPDSAAAKVISLPENAVPEFSGMKDFANWLKDMLAEGGDVTIASTGQTARFTRTNVGASVKRSRSGEHRNAYAGLREMVENAEYDHYEAPDERHPTIGGQDVYHSALVMGDKLYSVKLKLDVPTENELVQRKKISPNEYRENLRYKDHRLTEIEIAPALYRGLPESRWPTQPTDAISEVSLGVLRGSVKPSGIENRTLFQAADTPRARVTFGEADAYAMVEFFKAADPSSAPHEMYHIFRRIMADMFDDPNAGEASRERYRKACEFVGAEPGRVWTREQEEMFARAGERFLLEGVTPNPRMGDVMESFKQWMGEVYGNAERSGLEISDGMRDVFGKMMGTAEEGDISFRYALGKLLDYSPEKSMDTRVELPAEHATDAPEQALEAYMRDSAARLEEAYSALADRPEAQERFRAELEADMAEADMAVAEAQRRGEIMRAAAACIMRG